MFIRNSKRVVFYKFIEILSRTVTRQKSVDSIEAQFIIFSFAFFNSLEKFISYIFIARITFVSAACYIL